MIHNRKSLDLDGRTRRMKRIRTKKGSLCTQMSISLGRKKVFHSLPIQLESYNLIFIVSYENNYVIISTIKLLILSYLKFDT